MNEKYAALRDCIAAVVWDHTLTSGGGFVTNAEHVADEIMKQCFARETTIATPSASTTEPVAWRIRIRKDSTTYYIYTERLPFEPDEDSRIVILGEPVPLYETTPLALTTEKEALERIASLAITPDNGASVAMTMRRIAQEALSRSTRSEGETDVG